MSPQPGVSCVPVFLPLSAPLPPAAGAAGAGPEAALTLSEVRQSLQETVHSFKVTNEELAARGTSGTQDVAACDAACKVSQAVPLLPPAAGFWLHVWF